MKTMIKVHDVSGVVVWLVTVAAVVARVEADDALLVDTENGRVSGITDESVKGKSFYSFYGIPYARPPLGELRFKDPEPPVSWSGIHDASRPAAACTQILTEGTLNETNQIFGQEDCLYLNVFTPELRSSAHLSVMVWIHGGGFYFGSAVEYRPHVLLDYDVVLVVIQYRLGVLGFLTTEDAVMPGNLGLKDQTMALQWVQRNIHNFGGDKSRVTIFGEDAGGASVNYQMLTPKAKGLFSRAILQSGTALCPWALKKDPRHVAVRVGNTFGCPTDQGSDELLTCLQDKSANDLVLGLKDLQEWLSLEVHLIPWVDGDYLPAHTAYLVREGRYTHVDIMSGVTKDEGAIFVLPSLGTPSRLHDIDNNFSKAGRASLQLLDQSDGQDPVALARRIYLQYLGTTQASQACPSGLIKMLGDRHFNVFHDIFTAHHALLHPSKKTFRYELQHYSKLPLSSSVCPSCRQKVISHLDDLFYLFPGGILPAPPSGSVQDLNTADDLAVRHIMATLWTNFAATGDPTPDDSLGFKWEPSTAGNLHYLSITTSPSMKLDSRRQVRDFHSSLPTTENFIFNPHMVMKEPFQQPNMDCAPNTEL